MIEESLIRERVYVDGERISRFHPLGGALFDPSRGHPDTCGSYQIGAGQSSVQWDGGSVS